MVKCILLSKIMFRLFLVFVVSSVLKVHSLEGPTHGKKIVCIWSRWAYNQPVQGHPRFQLDTIDASLCTHVIYFNALYDIEKNIIKSLDPWQDLKRNNGLGNFLGIVGLKKRYPHLKVLIAVGDFINGPVTFSKMASDPEIRKIFVRNVKRFLKHFSFDGIDIHWYYPSLRGGAPYDKPNFVQLAKELSESFRPRGYIVTATIGAQDYILAESYDLESLGRHLNLILLNTKNYHYASDGIVGANAPMRGVDMDDTYSVGFTVDYLLSHGVPPHKIVLGLSYQGRNYILINPYLEDIQFGKTPTKFDGFKGPVSNFEGAMDYIEICMALSNTSTWSYHWDENSATPYARDQGKVISFDDAKSISIKIKLAIEKGFGGFSLQTIDQDDYLSICSPESHHEQEAYTDMLERLNTINNNTLLDEALKTLQFPKDKEYPDTAGPSYVLSKGKLKLRLPQVGKPATFKLTRIVNDLTTLGVQEKRILDEIKRIEKENMQYDYE